MYKLKKISEFTDSANRSQVSINKGLTSTPVTKVTWSQKLMIYPSQANQRFFFKTYLKSSSQFVNRMQCGQTTTLDLSQKAERDTIFLFRFTMYRMENQSSQHSN